MIRIAVTFATLFFCMTHSLSHAQAKTQATTIRKRSFDNPTIAIEQFNGSTEHRGKLEELLMRSGWVKVLPVTHAAQAMVRVNANFSSTQGSALFSATLTVNGKKIPVSVNTQQAEDSLRQATDSILNALFGIPALCSRKITFVRHGANNIKELYACYLDGSGQERLTFNRAISTEPAWGHAGALVYTLAKNNALSIVLMDYANKRQRIISQSKGLNASAALSPCGQFVALTLSRDKYVDLYVLDLKTNKYKRLTRDNSVESSPCWSPDGKTICFVSDALAIGAPRLFTVPADGSTPPQRLRIGGGEAVSPDWSKINNQLCFATKGPYGKYVIAILDMATPNGKPEIITAADGDWEAPSWAPDGRHIICTRARRGARDLVIVDSVRGSFRPITEGAILSLPAWQPAR